MVEPGMPFNRNDGKRLFVLLPRRCQCGVTNEKTLGRPKKTSSWPWRKHPIQEAKNRSPEVCVFLQSDRFFRPRRNYTTTLYPDAPLYFTAVREKDEAKIPKSFILILHPHRVQLRRATGCSFGSSELLPVWSSRRCWSSQCPKGCSKS